MAGELDLKIDANQVDSMDLALRAFPSIMTHNAKVAVRKTLSTVRREFIADSGVKLRGAKGGRQTRKSFNLSRSFIWRDTKGAREIDEVGGSFFTKSKIARLHEFGGTVRARKGLLAIPTEEARRADGSVKPQYRNPRRAMQKFGKDNFEFVPLPSGQGLIIHNVERGRKKKDGSARARKSRVVFALVRKVNMKPRLGWRRHYERTAKPEFARRMATAVELTLQEKRDKASQWGVSA